MGYFYHANASELQLQLAIERAEVATGPCGTEFIVAGLGQNHDKVAVAGQVMSADEASQYYMSEETEPDGTAVAVVYHRNGNNSNRVLRRLRPR